MDFWDQRFSGKEYVYGKDANEFIKNQLRELQPGKILFPGEGEGRNAVYAASLGWAVLAFDSSAEGRRKALEMAAENGLVINYINSSYQEFNSTDRFDAIALCFTHIPSSIRSEIHAKYISLLKDGGHLIMQAFRKEQLGLDSGGPKDLDMLFSTDELLSDFAELRELNVFESDEVLAEGPYHQGPARLINVVGVR